MTLLERKPLMEHLVDLRTCLIKSALVLVATTVAGFFFTSQLLQVVYWPLRKAGREPQEVLRVLGVVDPFTIQMELALSAGVIFALPAILYFVGQFLLPALTPKERGIVLPVFSAGAVLFLGGVAFCYWLLLPQTLQFFWDYCNDFGFRAEWTAQGYIDFVLQMLLGFGLAFELPLVILILHALGLVKAAALRSGRRVAIILIVIAAACITPGSDIFSLTVLSVPMYALYEACVWIAWWRERKGKSAPDVLSE